MEYWFALERERKAKPNSSVEQFSESHVQGSVEKVVAVDSQKCCSLKSHRDADYGLPPLALPLVDA